MTQETISDLMNGIQMPALAALLIGLLTAIHPCTLATNVAAVSFLVRGVGRRGRIVSDICCYVLGRMASLSLLAWLLMAIIRQGMMTLHIERQFNTWGEKVVGGVMIAVGLYLLLWQQGHSHDHSHGVERYGRKHRNALSAFLLGMIFALAFCPASGVMYFGMLIPLSLESSSGWLLPIVYAAASALPVMILAWIVAYSAENMARTMNRLATIQRWMNRIVGVVFIAAGLWLLLEDWL